MACQTSIELWQYYDDCPDACGKWYQIIKRLSYACYLCRVQKCFGDTLAPGDETPEIPSETPYRTVLKDIADQMENGAREIRSYIEE